MSAFEATARPHVVVVGGGITGLAAAYRLVKSANGHPLLVTVLEASDRLGGKLRTVDVGEVSMEAGADSFVVRKPWAVDLCKELGLGGELVVPASSGAYVWTRGRLVAFPDRSAFAIPASVGEVLRWHGLSIRGRFRAATEFFRRIRKDPGDESIGSLATRRLGREAARVLVGPLLAGLHAGDPDRLSVMATFPELVAWERGHDSLMRGARAALRAARKARRAEGEAERAEGRAIFATVWGGLSRLVETLENALGSGRIRTDTAVSAVQREGSGYAVLTPSGPLSADAIILGTPAFESARLLANLNPAAWAELAAIPYVSTAVVLLAFPPGTGRLLPEGTGFVVPPGERAMTACTWVSRKWPQPDEEDRAVLRCFVGRAGDESAVGLDDAELLQLVLGEVRSAVPLPMDPEAWRVVRWNRAMPQYEVGHLDRLARIDAALEATPGVFLAGSAYRGVGIADCVRQGSEAAGRAREYLRAGRRGDAADRAEPEPAGSRGGPSGGGPSGPDRKDS